MRVATGVIPVIVREATIHALPPTTIFATVIHVRRQTRALVIRAILTPARSMRAALTNARKWTPAPVTTHALQIRAKTKILIVVTGISDL